MKVWMCEDIMRDNIKNKKIQDNNMMGVNPVVDKM